MGRVLNKVYIVSGGLEPDDELGDYRFQTMRSLNKIFPGYVTTLNDIAIEVDTTGKHIMYETHSGDGYWTCEDIDNEHLTLNDCKLSVVARINDKWQKIEVNPYSDINNYLEEHGYEQPLGYGGGWYDSEHKPSYQSSVFNYFKTWFNFDYTNGTTDRLYLIPIMNRNKISIYKATANKMKSVEVGTILLNGDLVTISINNIIYSFRTSSDEDFKNFVRWYETDKFNTNSTKHTINYINIHKEMLDTFIQYQLEYLSTAFNEIVKSYRR